MSISNFFILRNSEENILQIMTSKKTITVQQKEIGLILFSVYKKVGCEKANNLIEKLKLQSLGFNFSCPALRK